MCHFKFQSNPTVCDFKLLIKPVNYPREASNIIPFFNGGKKNEAQNNCNLSKETSLVIKAY